MKSLLPLFVCVFGFFILLLIYYVLIYQRPETPFEVFIRLIRHNPETILAFTYKKIGPDEYLNYYVNDELKLEPRIQAFPVTFDSLPVIKEPNHGIISESLNGFIVTGIEFPFRCPGGWNYTDGKCHLEEVCQPDDHDVYKGINFYQFTETLNTNTAFHPRLFMDCNTNERKACAPNELYIGGESISNTLQPCHPYDICQDRLTMTTHNFPIFLGDVLQPNEFYFCQNGVSERRTCPKNSQFSTLQNGCLPVTRCFNLEDNTTIIGDNPNQFIICRGGEERIVSCGNGIFIQGDSIQCVNNTCLNPRLIFRDFNSRANIPIGWEFCPDGTNTPTTFTCDINITWIHDNVDRLINSPNRFPTIKPPHQRFESIQIPDVKFESQSKSCVSFDFDTNFTELGTHNDIIPEVPVNIQTLEIMYTNDEDDFFFKNYNVIMHHPSNTIVDIRGRRYCNFTTIPILSMAEYIREVELATGDMDGINYMVRGPMLAGLLSSTSIRLSPIGIESTGLIWNAYRTEFTTRDEAHSRDAMTAMGLFDFSSTTYTFKYRINENPDEEGTYILHMLSKFGFVSFQVTLNDGVQIDIENNVLFIEDWPDYMQIEAVLEGPNNTMIVSDIYNKSYNPNHQPYFLQYITILAITSPIDALSVPIPNFFVVNSRDLFMSNVIFEN